MSFESHDRWRQVLVYFGLAPSDRERVAGPPPPPPVQTVVFGAIVAGLVFGFLTWLTSNDSVGRAVVSGVLFAVLWGGWNVIRARRARKRSGPIG